MQKKLYTGKLLGREFQTDDHKLFILLATEQDILPREYPGFQIAVVHCLELLDEKRLQATHIFYLNHRVQAWALGFDADPTPPIRVVPTGVLMDPNGPVSFAS
jgi:hypothetical protein